MCCGCFKRKKRVKTANKIVNVEVPPSSTEEGLREVTATAGTHQTRNTKSSTSDKRVAARSLEGKRRTNESSRHDEIVGELHKRMKNKEVVTQEEVLKMSPAERKKRLAAAQKALGFTPNTAIMDRLVQRDKDKLERTQNSQMSRMETSSSKMGDITFGIPSKKKSDDDTQYPKLGSKKPEGAQTPGAEAYFTPPGSDQANQENEELLSDDEESIPDAQNWMYHSKEMQATQDIIRIADAAVADYAVGEMADHSRVGIVFDPYAPIEELEKDEEKQRKLFSCVALRYGTFVTTAQMAPTEKEKADAALKKAEEPIVNVINAGADVSQFLIDYPDNISALSDSDKENVLPATEDIDVKRTKESQKKMASVDRGSHRSSCRPSVKLSRKESKEKPRMSIEEKTSIPTAASRERTKTKHSKEEKQKSKETKKDSKESNKPKPLGRARSRESSRPGSNEKKKEKRKNKSM